jgi:TctA family transporter
MGRTCLAVDRSRARSAPSAFLLAFASPPFARFAHVRPAEFFATTLLAGERAMISKGQLLMSLMSLFLGVAIGAIGTDRCTA